MVENQGNNQLLNGVTWYQFYWCENPSTVYKLNYKGR